MDGFEAVVETVGPSRKYKDYTNVSIPVAYIMCVCINYLVLQSDVSYSTHQKNNDD